MPTVSASCPLLDLRDTRAFWRGAQVDLTFREFAAIENYPRLRLPLEG